MSHRLLATGIAIALASVTLTANIVVPAEFRDVVTSATVIVRGRVTDVRSVIAPDRTISSFATIAVESVLKGDAPNLAIEPCHDAYEPKPNYLSLELGRRTVHRFRLKGARDLPDPPSRVAPLRVDRVADLASKAGGDVPLPSAAASAGVGLGSSLRSAMPHRLEAMK